LYTNNTLAEKEFRRIIPFIVVLPPEIKMDILLKVIYRISEILIKIPMTFITTQ
jgi:hypothetical protein